VPPIDNRARDAPLYFTLAVYPPFWKPARRSVYLAVSLAVTNEPEHDLGGGGATLMVYLWLDVAMPARIKTGACARLCYRQDCLQRSHAAELVFRRFFFFFFFLVLFCCVAPDCPPQVYVTQP